MTARPAWRSVLALALLVAGLALAACTPAPAEPRCTVRPIDPYVALDCPAGGTVTFVVESTDGFGGMVHAPESTLDALNIRNDYTVTADHAPCPLAEGTTPDGDRFFTVPCEGAAQVTVDLGDSPGFVGLGVQNGTYTLRGVW